MAAPSATYTNPNLLTDDEIRKLGIPEHSVELYRRRHYSESFGIGTWYDKLGFCTFRTETIDLPFDEANALVDMHYGKQLTGDLLDALQRLTNKIDTKIRDSFGTTGAFVKLDTRSPKDVPVYATENKTIQQLIDKEIDKLHNIMDEDEQTNAFVIATNRYLKVTTGDHAINLLTTSTRIPADLNRALDFGKDLFSAKIILREWNDYVPAHPEMEFRAFVRNNELNALTQYFSFIRYPYLIEHKEELKNKIIQFFNSVKHLIPHESYVIDFLVMEHKVMIIELNPFHIGAGACLFSWNKDRDIIMGGPFEFRINEQFGNPIDELPVKWQKYIQDRCRTKKLVARGKQFLGGSIFVAACAIIIFKLIGK